MKNWFEEKEHQLSECSMEAFGIPIMSRYFKADEMAEMILFCKDVAEMQLQGFVKSVFYNSNSNCCDIEIVEAPGFLKQNFEPMIYEAAMRHISQFLWTDGAAHGKAL